MSVSNVGVDNLGDVNDVHEPDASKDLSDVRESGVSNNLSDVNEPDFSSVKLPEASNDDTQREKTKISNKIKKSELDRLLTPTVLKKLQSITSNVDSNSCVKEVTEGKRTTRPGKEIKSSNG